MGICPKIKKGTGGDSELTIFIKGQPHQELGQ